MTSPTAPGPLSDPSFSEAIAPVPAAGRVLRARDLAVLWGSLGVGLLVMESGAFLADLGPLLAGLAIALGSLIGTLLLATAGRIGAAEGVPTMVLLRPVLGLRGSYLASALNVLQLVGWTAFELWVMGKAAGVVSGQLFGYAGPLLWILLFGAVAILMALGGPLTVVRKWLERFGVWVMLAASLYLTVRLLASPQAAGLFALPNRPDGFWRMVDLVIAMPISWLPLVADYNRYARSPSAGFRGTFWGYLVANMWFYMLGALFVLSQQLSMGTAGPTPESLALAILALAGGALALVAVLADEVDNVFADIYSAAVSVQNVFPRLPQRALVAGIGGLGIVLAAVVTMGDYFNFLLLIGSIFIPLFGLLIADYYWVRRGRPYASADFFPPAVVPFSTTTASLTGGVNLFGMAVWIFGILVFQWAQGTGLPIGASLPAFASTALAYGLLQPRLQSRGGDEAS